jgi:hypothetical protein
VNLPDFLPAGTTWLDLGTLAVAAVALFLTLRRDLREGKRSIRFEVRRDEYRESPDVLVEFANTGARVLTVKRAGFSVSKRGTLEDYAFWRERNFRNTGHLISSDPAFPEPLLAGGVPYVAKADTRELKTVFFPASPSWVWCVDERGKTRWARIPEEVTGAIRASKRFAPGPEDDYGQPTRVEIADDEEPPKL